SPGTVKGGVSFNLTVTLDSPAPQYGLIVNLAGSPTGIVKLPTSIFIAQGSTQGTITVQTNAVSTSTDVTI
ncbi:hypothetical protein ACSTJO_00045, partial [Vibrio parahaemolyticus]